MSEVARHDFFFMIRQKLQARLSKFTAKIGLGKFDRKEFSIENHKIIIPALNEIFHNYKIIQISDIHYGQWITADRLKGVVELINECNPDLVAITGDFVSYLLDDSIKEMSEQLKKLKPKDATIAVLGNHDHWLGAEKVRAILRKSNILDISNSLFVVSKSRFELIFAGVDSVMQKKDRLDLVLEKMDSDAPAILLAHEPDFAEKSAVTKRFSLQLSGHSHGGQFIIPKIGTPIRGRHFWKYPLGKYTVGEMILYTNRGIGTNSYWLRVNCPPEITVISLQ